MRTIRFDHNGRWTRVEPEPVAHGSCGDGGSAGAEAEPEGLPAAGPIPAAPAAPAPQPPTPLPTAPKAPAAGAAPTGSGSEPTGEAAAPVAAIADTTPTGPLRPPAEVREDIVRAIGTIYDPEIPVDIYQLGLIYDVSVDPSGKAAVKMTLTSPGCFAAQVIPGEVKAKVVKVPGVTAAQVDVVWDPPWNMSMMSDAAKLALNMAW